MSLPWMAGGLAKSKGRARKGGGAVWVWREDGTGWLRQTSRSRGHLSKDMNEVTK